MKIRKVKKSNIVFVIFIVLLVIPQTRQSIQVVLNKGLALFSPSVTKQSNRVTVSDYNWKLTDESGHEFNFSEAKGKVIVINFWATWCPPCIAEMPSLEKLYKSYHADVVFLFVSNESQQVISQFMEKNDFSFKVYSSKTPYPKEFDVTSIPRTFLIDQSGTIIIDKTGAANWNSETVWAQLDNLIQSSPNI